jgi:rhamnose utilization protein RhaD (predicted bifunctional aldolase and dehydrogenase)
MFNHPSNVCMTYLQHMKLSLELSSLFFIGSIKAFIHAFIPDIFITSSTDIVRIANQKMKKVGCR